jgi:NADH-quinone oxidoreductase subunit J
MLMNLSKDTEPQKNKWLKLAGAVAGGCLLLVMVAALRNTEKNMTELATGDIGLIQNLGRVLFSEYVVPFEISSVLFLSAMVGAVVLGKREKDDELQEVEIVSSYPHDEQKVLEKIDG